MAITEEIKKCHLQSMIGKRAVEMVRRVGGKAEVITFMIDLDYVEEHCPIDLEQLLNFNDGDFAHDMFGINTNLNHETHELDNCFLPRCARKYKGG